MADEAKLIAVVEANTKQIENAMKRLVPILKGSTDQMTASIKKLDQQVGIVAGSFNKLGKAFTVTAAIGAAKQLAGVFADTAKKAGDLVDAANKIGISATKLEALRFAAEQSGVSIGELDGALSKLSKGLAEARQGSGDLFKLLKANGMTEVQIKALSLMEAFDKVADIIKNASDATDAGKISTLAFGKSLDEMTQMLNGGAAGVKELTDAFMKLHPMTDTQKQKLAGMDDELQRLNTEWGIGVDKMTLWGLTAIENIGMVEHAVVDAIKNLAGTAGPYLGQTTPGRLPWAPWINPPPLTPGQRIENTPLPTEPTGTAKAALEAAAKARAGGTPSVVPAATGAGKTKSAKDLLNLTEIHTKRGLKGQVAGDYAEQFQGLIDYLEAMGYDITSLGEGGYSKRRTRGPGTRGGWSQHAFGRALDINPAQNPMGQPLRTNLPPNIAAIAQMFGLTWGGTWKTPDAMHFVANKKLGQEGLNKGTLAIGQTEEQTKAIADEEERMAKAALEHADAWKESLDAIANANQALKRDVVGGLIKDLERGVKPAEAFANALMKISDALLDRALNAIFPDVASTIFGAALAGGGVMTSRGPMPLRKYAGGGVAHSPQVAMFGEGGRPEAYVPLPDGRRIPVNIRVPGMGGLGGGRGGQGVAVHNRVTVEPSPLFVVTTQEVARQAGHAAVAEAGDGARRRPGGR